MKGVRLIAAALCALLVLAVPVMADDGLELPGVVDPNDMPALEQPAEPSPEPSPESPPAPEPAPPAEPPQEPTGDGAGNNARDAAGTNSAGTENGNSSQLDDGLWGDWSNPSNIPGKEEPSEAQQELEEARRELEEKQQQREEAFREAERENAALPEEEEKQKKPADSKAADAAPTELVLPQREARTSSPVRYILIGALLAGALCIAIYLFTHPAREDDPADETKS